MDIEPWQYLVTFVLIGFSGLIDSIAGGGGLISVPTYIAVGLPPDFILGTNKCVSSTGATLAVYRYICSKAILWQMMVFSIIAALIGSVIGANLSHYLSKDIMFLILLLVIPIIFFLQLKQGDTAVSAGPLSPARAAFRATVIGFVIVGYDGLFGPGTGTFLLLMIVDQPPVSCL